MAVPEEHAWFEQAVMDTLPALYGSALRLTGGEADAEDLVADALVKAWSGIDGLSDRSCFRGWLFRIMTNTFMSRRRAAARRGGVHESLDAVDDGFSLFERLHAPVLLWWGNPEREFLNRLLREDLEHALAAVPEAFRVAVIMADVQGFSYQEIADMLDVPIGTVRSRLARGRAQLQKALWQQARDAGITADHPNTETARP